MIDLIWLVIIATIALALGRTVLTWLRLAPDDLPRQWLYGGALGLGLLGFGVFALTVLHWLSLFAALAVLVLSGALSLPMLIQSTREIARGARSLRRDQISPIGWIAVGLFAANLIVNLISCFNPPIDLDVLGYHLAVPKLNIVHNEFVLRPDIVYANWPMHQELLFQLALLVSGDALAQLISFSVAALATGALWACARPRLSPAVAALAAFIFYTIPIIGYEASIAYVNVGVALYATLAWFALIEWHATCADRWLALSALMAGFAPAVKLSGAFIPALLCIGVLLFAPSGRDRWKSSIGYGIIVSTVIAPWLLKTFLQTGNPVTPYLFDLIGARGWTHSAASQSTAMFAPFGMGRDLVAALILPWNVTMFSTAFGGGNIGPIFLACLPLLLIVRPLPLSIRSALGLILAYWAIWFWFVQEVRFLIPVLPLFSLVAAYVLAAWARQNRPARNVVLGLVLFTGFANVILLGTNFARPPGSVPPTKSLGVVLGQVSRLDYLRRVLPSQQIIEQINQLPPPSLVLTLGLSDVYRIDRSFIRGFPIEQALFDPYELSDPRAMSDRIRLLGITHVVINRTLENGYYVYAPNNNPPGYADDVEALVKQDLIPVQQLNGYTLYEVRH